ncbi:hypothetical protein BST61_g10546 [Cercospora zeina]
MSTRLWNLNTKHSDLQHVFVPQYPACDLPQLFRRKVPTSSVVQGTFPAAEHARDSASTMKSHDLTAITIAYLLVRAAALPPNKIFDRQAGRFQCYVITCIPGPRGDAQCVREGCGFCAPRKSTCADQASSASQMSTSPTAGVYSTRSNATTSAVWTGCTPKATGAEEKLHLS